MLTPHKMKNIERRGAERVRSELSVRWEGAHLRLSGTVVDLSVTGCFILTQDLVDVKELIRVEITPPNGSTIFIWGEVVYKAPEIGFGLRFTGNTEDDEKCIQLLVSELRGLSRS
jgi:c-di-GMP-binding flagellar brake protein YcgR